MKGKYLLVYIGRSNDGEKLSGFGSRPLSVVELPIDVEGEGEEVSYTPNQAAIEKAVHDVMLRHPDEVGVRGRDDRARRFLLVDLDEAQAFDAVPASRAEIRSWVGGVL